MFPIQVTPLTASDTTIAALADILVEVVAHGGSVSFMHPLDPTVAADFWRGSLEKAAAGERVVFGAWADGAFVGTVTLDLCQMPNQPHRAEIAKLMTRVGHRGRGVATALMAAAEAEAVARRRFLLVLDTAEEEGAADLYRRLGYTAAGTIPDYALKPHGGLTGTIVFWKRLPTA